MERTQNGENGDVRLKRQDREIGRMLCANADPKEISAALELALGTVHSRIRRMCGALGLRDRIELTQWFREDPHRLEAGYRCTPGLHPQPCHCGSPGCTAMLATQFTPPAAPTPWNPAVILGPSERSPEPARPR